MRLVQTLSALAFAARVAFAVPVEAGEAAEITDDDLTAVSFAPGECKCPPPNNDLVTTTGTPEGTMKTYKGRKFSLPSGSSGVSLLATN